MNVQVGDIIKLENNQFVTVSNHRFYKHSLFSPVLCLNMVLDRVLSSTIILQTDAVMFDHPSLPYFLFGLSGGPPAALQQ